MFYSQGIQVDKNCHSLRFEIIGRSHLLLFWKCTIFNKNKIVKNMEKNLIVMYLYLPFEDLEFMDV